MTQGQSKRPVAETPRGRQGHRRTVFWLWPWPEQMGGVETKGVMVQARGTGGAEGRCKVLHPRAARAAILSGKQTRAVLGSPWRPACPPWGPSQLPCSPAQQRLPACCPCSQGRSSGLRPAVARTAGPPGEPAREEPVRGTWRHPGPRPGRAGRGRLERGWAGGDGGSRSGKEIRSWAIWAGCQNLGA